MPVPGMAETACHTPEFDEIARVRYVHDGDTIHLQDGQKIRLIGINAPELGRDGMPDQAYAREARTSLDAAITSAGNRVGLVYGADRQDRYKRILAHLFTTDGENLQARLLSEGMAVAIAHPPNLAFTRCYSELELAARCSGDGIWSEPGQMFVQASTLKSKHKGFRLVSGTIDRISLNEHGARIFMGKLVLGIHSDNLVEFDEAQLLSLSGRRVTARGWLQPKRRKASSNKSPDPHGAEFYMHIRHPSAIEISPPNSEAKC